MSEASRREGGVGGGERCFGDCAPQINQLCSHLLSPALFANVFSSSFPHLPALGLVLSAVWSTKDMPKKPKKYAMHRHQTAYAVEEVPFVTIWGGIVLLGVFWKDK
jgi:hypothetical protein